MASVISRRASLDNGPELVRLGFCHGVGPQMGRKVKKNGKLYPSINKRYDNKETGNRLTKKSFCTKEEVCDFETSKRGRPHACASSEQST